MSPQSTAPTRSRSDSPPAKTRATRTYPPVTTLVVAALLLGIASALAALVSGSTSVLMQALLTGFLMGGVYSLVAMGLTLVYGVLHVINFANGALVVVAMYVTFLAVDRFGMHPYVAIVITVPIIALLGGGIQFFLLNPIMRSPIHTQLLVTIGVALVLESVLLIVAGPNPRSVALPGDFALSIAGASINVSRLYAFIGALGTVALLWVVLHGTRLGTAIRSVAASPEGARLVGIDVNRIYVATFAFGAAAAGAAGTLIAPFTTIEPYAGATFNLTAFVVVVLGGMGNVPGALVGGLIVGLTEQLGGLILPGQSPLLAVFVVFLLVLFAKPQGIFGRSTS